MQESTKKWIIAATIILMAVLPAHPALAAGGPVYSNEQLTYELQQLSAQLDGLTATVSAQKAQIEAANARATSALKKNAEQDKVIAAQKAQIQDLKTSLEMTNKGVKTTSDYSVWLAGYVFNHEENILQLEQSMGQLSDWKSQYELQLKSMLAWYMPLSPVLSVAYSYEGTPTVNLKGDLNVTGATTTHKGLNVYGTSLFHGTTVFDGLMEWVQVIGETQEKVYHDISAFLGCLADQYLNGQLCPAEPSAP